MNICFLSLLFSILYVSALAKSGDDIEKVFIFLPHGLHFTPLKANIQEPRIGLFKFLDAGEMKVDIGNSIDVFELSIPTKDIKFTVGIDFMAYALTTNAEGLRLQIDAIDGFFGGNLSFSKSMDGQSIQSRFRILHHSAHFVDGHFNATTNTWVNNRPPTPYTRDFGEIIAVHSLTQSFGYIRYYGGISYASLVRPPDFKRYAYQGGAELVFDKLFGTILEQPTNLYVAYHISLLGTPAYSSANQIQVGVKFGNWFKKGTTIYLAYYNGRHIFAEYYSDRLTTIGAGFTVDFF